MNRQSKSRSTNWLVNGLSSTIGQKMLMGATGLLLCGFLVVHLAGNLLLIKGSESYNAYADALHSNELLPVAEIGLLVLFVIHIVLGFVTTRSNSAARNVTYAVKETKIQNSTLLFAPSSTMFATGLVVLIFLVLHVSDMRLGHLNIRLEMPEHESPYDQAVRVLRDPISFGVYIVGSLILGLHLAHGFQSAFRSLGLNHPKYTPFLHWLGVIFSIVIAFGFASLPLWAKAIMKTH